MVNTRLPVTLTASTVWRGPETTGITIRASVRSSLNVVRGGPTSAWA